MALGLDPHVFFSIRVSWCTGFAAPDQPSPIGRLSNLFLQLGGHTRVQALKDIVFVPRRLLITHVEICHPKAEVGRRDSRTQGYRFLENTDLFLRPVKL